MPVPNKVRAFLDSSALFAGVYSVKDGAYAVLALGTSEAIQVLVSSDVLAEVEEALRRKAPETLGLLALLLERSRVEVVPPPHAETVQKSHNVTRYMADSQILAAAWDAGIDYFVTLDRQHFLDNEQLQGAIPFLTGTPGDFLAWYREQIGS